MKKHLTKWMIVCMLCMLSSWGLLAQTYSPAEVLAIKTVFAKTSADGSTTNGSKVGVTDTATWNPAVTAAGLTWRNINDTMRVVEINWSNKGMAGAFAGSPLNALSQLEKADMSKNSFTGLRFGSKYLRELIISDNKTLMLPSFWTADFVQITNMDSLRVYEAKNTNISNVNYGTTSFRNLTTFICDSSNVSALTLSTSAGLPKLTTLSVKGNRLSDFAANILAAPLVNVAIENNSINQFSKLPKQATIVNYTYAPQKDYWNLGSKFWTVELDLSSEFSTVRNGVTRYTTYTWFDITSGTEEAIPASSITDHDNGKFTFSESLAGKRLRCKMTNSNFSGLTLTAEVVLFKYNEEEIAALKTFFRQMSADGVTTNGAKLGVTNIDNWNPAVETANVQWGSSGTERRIEYFFWGSKGIAGDLDLSVFTNIVSPNLSDNKLTSVTFNPGMTTMNIVYMNNNLFTSIVLPEKSAAYNDVRVANNQLKFSTLPKNKISNYNNAPQATINGGEINYNDVVDLSAEAFVKLGDGEQTETDYTWVDITDGTERVFDGISSTGRGKFTFASSSVGKILRCKMTNASLPLFTGDNALKYEVTIKSTSVYNEAEVEAFKEFFRQMSAREGITNGAEIGISDVDNWDPATQNASIAWSNDAINKRAKRIDWLGRNFAGNLDLRPMQQLSYIDVDKNPINSLVLADVMPELTTLWIFQTSIETIEMPTSAPKLVSIQAQNSSLTGLVIPSDAILLEDVIANNSKLKYVRFPRIAMNKLSRVWLHKNELEELVLPSSSTTLRFLYFYDNKLANITMPDAYLDNLRYMYAENNFLTYATLPAYPSLGIYSATPQAPIEGGEIAVTATIDLSDQYNVTILGTTNTTQYTWYYLTGDSENLLPATAVTHTGNGKFTLASYLTGRELRCQMTNAHFPTFEDYHDGSITKTYNVPLIYNVKVSGSTVTIPGTEFTITATAGAGGAIAPSGATTLTYGGSQTYTITADAGYKIKSVLVDGTAETAAVGASSYSYTFSNVTANHTISAEFEQNIFTITATAGANGTIAPSGTTTVTYGGNQAYTITADAGYRIKEVLIDGINNEDAVSNGSYTFVNVTANHSISAAFEEISIFTITATAGANGTIAPNGATTLTYGDSQEYTITANEGYKIKSVLVDGTAETAAVGASSYSYTFSNVTANHTISAEFEQITYTITATAGANGSIAPSGITTVSYGSNQAYTITANAGYAIKEVKIDNLPEAAAAGKTTYNYTFSNVKANHTISATFEIANPELTGITVNNQPQTISSAMDYMAACGEQSVSMTLTAVGEVKVNGAAYTNGSPISLTGDKTVITITVTAGSNIATYTLTVAKALGSATPLYIERWGATLAIVNNPANNGGYTFDQIQWYKASDNTPAGTGAYVVGNISTHYADVHAVETGAWHHTCRTKATPAPVQIVVYPNPVLSAQTLNVKLPEGLNEVNIDVYDINGKLVKQHPRVTTTLTAPAGTGIYVLKIQLPDGSITTEKIVVK